MNFLQRALGGLPPRAVGKRVPPGRSGTEHFGSTSLRNRSLSRPEETVQGETNHRVGASLHKKQTARPQASAIQCFSFEDACPFTERLSSGIESPAGRREGRGDALAV